MQKEKEEKAARLKEEPKVIELDENENPIIPEPEEKPEETEQLGDKKEKGFPRKQMCL